MKKFLLSLVVLALGSTAFAQTEDTFDSDNTWFTNKSANATEASATSTVTGVTYKYLQAYQAGGYLMIKGKNTTPKGYIEFTLPFDCSNIALVSKSGASGNQAVTVTAGETEILTNTKIPNTANGTLNVAIPAANQAAGTTYRITVSVNYNVQLTKIAYTKAGGVVKDDAEMSFPEASYEVKLGETFTAPVLSKATDADPVYTSSNEEVATVDAATGAVTLVAAGTTTITATCDATPDFNAGTASYELKVIGDDEVYSVNLVTTQDFVFDNGENSYPWSYDSKYGLKGSAYVNGVQASDVIAESPTIDLSNRKAPVTLTCHWAFNQYKVNNVLTDVANLGQYAKVVVLEEGATDWTEVFACTAEKFAWTYFNQEINLDAYAGKKIQIGFRYISTAECAGTWEIDNVTVKAKLTDAVETIAADDTNAPAVYYNLQGVRVDNPANGLYIRVQGKNATKVLVK